MKPPSPPKVEDVMTREVVSIDPEKTVKEALQLMQQHDIGTLVVMVGRTPRVLESWRIKPGDLAKKVKDMPMPPCRIVTPDTLVQAVHHDLLESSLVAVGDPRTSQITGVLTSFDLAR